MNKTILLIAAAAFAFATANAQAAAPFCAVHSFGKQCFYYSLADCRQSGNYCVVNPNVRQTGSGPFCVVKSHGADCFYYNARSCQAAAARAVYGGVCVAR